MSALLVRLVKSYSVLPIVLQCIMKKDLFWHFLRSLLIMTYLITLNLEEGVLVLEKSLEKTWILDLKSVLTHQIVILTSEYLLPSLVGPSPFSYSFMLAKRSKKKKTATRNGINISDMYTYADVWLWTYAVSDMVSCQPKSYPVQTEHGLYVMLEFPNNPSVVLFTCMLNSCLVNIL